jgi:hypothetical protein
VEGIVERAKVIGPRCLTREQRKVFGWRQTTASWYETLNK